MHRSRRFGQGRHAGRVDHDPTLRAGTKAFAADSVFVAKRDMDHAPLPAVHGIEVERRAGALYFIGRGKSAHSQLFNSERAVIIGIERYS